MSKPHNIGARTFGIKLLEPRGNVEKVEFPVTTRRFDIERYKLTGEIEYIDEEGTTVPSVSQIENCKTLKEEITTIEQFEEIGSYRDVAKKYMVSVGTTHALMMHLRYKKEREDREMELVNAGLKVNEVEMNPSETYHVPPDEQNGVSDELKDQSACDCPKKGIDEACEAYYGDVSEFETHVKELEERWSEPKELTVEDRWNQVGNMLAGIKESIVHVRRMEIKRVEAEIEERLMKMMAGESA